MFGGTASDCPRVGGRGRGVMPFRRWWTRRGWKMDEGLRDKDGEGERARKVIIGAPGGEVRDEGREENIRFEK